MYNNYNKYPIWRDVKESQWVDWKWQYDNCIQNIEDLAKVIKFSQEEIREMKVATSIYRMKISPHICLRMAENDDATKTLRKQFIPSYGEINVDDRMYEDVNADSRYMPVKGLVHRYPTKVLVFPSNNCGSFCRYCFRRKYVGECDSSLPNFQRKEIIEYLNNHNEINEVIFSGGDPLTISDEEINIWMSELVTIPSVRIVRFHTRMPITIPYRITNGLITLMSSYRKRFAIYFVIHIDTLNEISDEAFEGLENLINVGIICLASTPLLKDINDSKKSLGSLWQSLVEHRIKPYYLFQTDPVQGTTHFVVPLSKGIDIVRNLYDTISGIAMPLYCFNIPDGGGHVLISPSTIKRITRSKYEITNFEGKKYTYIDPAEGD